MLTPLQQSIVPVLATNAAIAAMTDANAATAINAPILTPRTNPITIVFLAGSTIWGFAKTSAFQAAMQAVIAAGGSNGAQAETLLAIVSGTGFDATDPQVQGLGPTFVAMSGGVIAAADVTLALNTTSYLVGTGNVQTADVTAARAQLALQVSAMAVQAAWASAYNAGVATIQAGIASGTVPTLAQLVAGIAT
jgi:hypothetical protein